MVLHLILECLIGLLCASCGNMTSSELRCCVCIPLRLGCFLIAFANFVQGLSMVGVYYSIHLSKATNPLSLAYLTYGIVYASFSILLFFGILRGLVPIGGELDLVPALKDFTSTKSRNIAVFTTEAFAAGGNSERVHNRYHHFLYELEHSPLRGPHFVQTALFGCFLIANSPDFGQEISVDLGYIKEKQKCLITPWISMAILLLLIFVSVGSWYTYKIWKIDPHVAVPSAMFIPVYAFLCAYFIQVIFCYRRTLKDEKGDGHGVEDGEKKPLVDKHKGQQANPPSHAPPPQMPPPRIDDGTPCLSVVIKTIVKGVWHWVFDKPKK